MLDENLRRRVAEIAAGDSGGLESAACERIVQRLVTEGPHQVRRARRARIAMMAAGPVLAAAAAAVLLVKQAHHPLPVADLSKTPAVVVAVAAPKACAARPVQTGGAFVTSGGAARLELGAVANAVATPDSNARVVELGSCKTILALDLGRVSVHAKDLGGGELTVRARDGEVTVHGTIFAVEQTTDSLIVEVAEGRVGVKDRVGVHEVSAGQRLLVSALGVAQGELGAERTAVLRKAVGAPVVVGLETLEAVSPEGAAPAGRVAAVTRAPSAGAATHVGPQTATSAEAVELAQEAPAPEPAKEEPVRAPDLLSQAEEARHAGDFGGARELYRRVAVGQGPTAEAAWVALARMELQLGHGAAARDATKQRQDRFGQGTLAPEALWIDVRSYRQTGDLARARSLAEELVRRWPSSPQARAAGQWLAAD